LKGLEATEVRRSVAMSGTETSRIDPEYFNRDAIVAQANIGPGQSLGDLVLDGYRVVYETTQAIDREEGERLGLPYFLQAADISTPFINAEGMICVPEADWIRYPKGRIKPGELLIEVKGKAEKVALVPDGFPAKTLVTGTCFKLTTKRQIDRYFLAAYLISRYGQALKDRLKSNLLVAYIAKDDLYGLPVPKVSDKLKLQLQRCFESIFSSQGEARSTLNVAERHLLVALGLDGWTPPDALSYVRTSSQAFAAGRFDAEYFHPAKVQALMDLRALSDVCVGDFFDSIRELWQPTEAEGSPVRNYDLTDALDPFLDPSKPTTAPEEIASIKKRIAADDLVVSRLRSYLREIAVVLPSDDGITAVASTEFIVLRPKRRTTLTVEALLIYLRSHLPQIVFKWSQDGSNHPRFDERELLNLPVPRALITDQATYETAVRQMVAHRQRATRLLDAAKRAVEIAIEDGEQAALRYLQDAL
jgi:hypothetical protein